MSDFDSVLSRIYRTSVLVVLGHITGSSEEANYCIVGLDQCTCPIVVVVSVFFRCVVFCHRGRLLVMFVHSVSSVH